MTYGTKCHCALIPIPPITSLLQIAIIKPFNSVIWFYFGVSAVTSAAIWRMYRGRGAVDSHWQLAAGIFMMFIGQGAEFSRRNRFVLAVLLNIICLSVFLLSNLYEGAITSALIQPDYNNRLKTIEDLLASKYRVRSTEAFAHQYRNSSLFKLLAKRLEYLNSYLDTKDMVEQSYVHIRLCDEAERFLRRRVDDKLISEYYYILPETLTWEFIRLEASYLNPFLDRFQYYMDLCFQAGLPKMWKLFENQDYSKLAESHDVNDFLRLQDLESNFGILLFGCGLSCFALIIEIFCHDCLVNFNIKVAAASVHTIILNNLFRNGNRKMLKVRQVIVQPRPRQ
ncbi:hypothetical protein ACKWTF_015842 [Chironomus riparius]